MRSPYLDNDFIRTVFRAPESALASSEVSLRLIADGNPALLRIPTDRGLGGGSGRLSEAASRGLLEFLFKAEYAYDMGMPQWVARLDHAFLDFPPRASLPREAQDLPFPGLVPGCPRWIRSGNVARPTQSFAAHISTEKALRPWYMGHLKGDRNYTTELHKLLTLELVHRLFVDNPKARRSWRTR